MKRAATWTYGCDHIGCDRQVVAGTDAEILTLDWMLLYPEDPWDEKDCKVFCPIHKHVVNAALGMQDTEQERYKTPHILGTPSTDLSPDRLLMRGPFLVIGCKTGRISSEPRPRLVSFDETSPDVTIIDRHDGLVEINIPPREEM